MTGMTAAGCVVVTSPGVRGDRGCSTAAVACKHGCVAAGAGRGKEGYYKGPYNYVICHGVRKLDHICVLSMC